MTKVYNTIQRPYDNNISRSSDSDIATTGDGNIGMTDFGTIPAFEGLSPGGEINEINSSFQMSEDSINGPAIDNIWIKTFIKSQNYKPGVNGFMIDGISGDVEFGEGNFRGEITATSGKIGSATNYWSIGENGLTAFSTDADVIINYGKTDFGQDGVTGFILGYDYSAAKPKFEIGSSANKIFKYDGTDLTMVGGTITGGIIQSATSGVRVKIESNSIYLYDASVARAILIGGNNPLVLYDSGGTDQGRIRVEIATDGESSGLNHDGAVGIRTTNDFYLRSGYLTNKSVVSFMANFDDGRTDRVTVNNSWLKFKVNSVAGDNDHNLSLFSKTLIDPVIALYGVCGTPSANKLIRGIGAYFAASDVGKTVWNRVDDTTAIITGFTSETELTLDTDIFDTAAGEGYEIYTIPTAYLDVNSDVIRLRDSKTPSSSGDTGNKGDMCWDADYFYICTATDTWERTAIATW